MEGKIRIGMIGCGQIAQHHMRTYKEIPEAEMVACCDINKAAAKKSSETFGIPDVYTDFHEMLKREDIDAVDVCLHNNYHMPATVAALQAGKHVYCEKPMAGAYVDAKRMLDVARETGKRLHIQLSTLYSNETKAAKELIDLGEVGRIFHARSTGFRRRGRPYVDGYGTPSFVQKAHASGGALYDMGVYHIAQVLYLMGNPAVERISGKVYQETDMDEERRRISNYDVEEIGMGFVRFAGGATLDIIEAWAANLDGFEGSSLLGSKAGIRLSPFGFFKNIGNIELNATANLGAAAFRWDNVRGDGPFYRNSQAHWIAALLGKCPLIPTAEIALNTMLVSEGIYLSDHLGREVTADEVLQHSVSTSVPI
ncbi:MAG: Gfo/Idh/MocA family oxidoreductase [Fimbriimonadales bacterium]